MNVMAVLRADAILCSQGIKRFGRRVHAIEVVVFYLCHLL